ncbi:IS30 family transposase [Cryobacterium sp. Hz9]|nr:IS30 family transposase [Cryobacterium sp. Hz9]
MSDDLAVVFAGQGEMQVSHESIYQSLYVQSRGYVGVHLHRHPRRGRSARKPRATQLNAAGEIRDKVMLSERPTEANDRLVSGHWEGDLIVGSASGSAIATLIERTTRFVVLVHLPNGASSERSRQSPSTPRRGGTGLWRMKSSSFSAGRCCRPS